MITEKGTVKTSVKQDEKLYNELNKTLRNLGIVCIVAGAVILACAVIVLAINIWEGVDDADFYVYFIAGAVFLALGIFYVLLCKNAAKKALQIERVEETEFFGDYLIEKEYTDGEQTSANKVYYKWIVRIKETKNYLFLYNTRATCIAVDKNSLTPNELNTVRALLGRAPQIPPAPMAMQSGVTPAEPFAEMTASQPPEKVQANEPVEETATDMTEPTENKEE
ncbi:MAG: YcxB family protein [Clostridiales bacterium]|nr:YcxB family protein [Clostridiales bacterium]